MRNILLVDDEEELLENLTKYIRSYTDVKIMKDINIDKTTDSLIALEMIKKKNYDIIATDLVMPNLNGHQLLVEAKKLNAYQKAILFSAFAEKEVITDLINSDLIDIVIDKPIKPYEFRDYLLKTLESCKTDEKQLKNSIFFIAKQIYAGLCTVEDLNEEIIKAVLIEGNLKVEKTALKSKINKDKLYAFKRKYFAGDQND